MVRVLNRNWRYDYIPQKTLVRYIKKGYVIAILPNQKFKIEELSQKGIAVWYDGDKKLFFVKPEM